MPKYTIKSIDNNTGNVTVTFDIDNKEQVIAGVPLDDPKSTKQYLSDYARAYKAGLQVQKPEVAPGVTNLVGKQQDTDKGD